jgi:hypothetical protein
LDGENSDGVPGLFGWVPEPPREQGRPAFAWTREKSNRVMVLFAAGYRHVDIGKVIGCDAKTLRKVFSRECAAAATAELTVRSGLMAKLVDQAEAGNVGAIKQLDTMLQAEKARAASGRVRRRGKDAEAKPAVPAIRLGKKDQAKHDAAQAQGRFAPRPAPQGSLLN